jgi:hypothetical protein
VLLNIAMMHKFEADFALLAILAFVGANEFSARYTLLLENIYEVE